MKYVINKTIDGSMTDFQMNLSVVSMFHIIEDAVTNLMHLLKIDGVIAKEKYGAYWVFVKKKIEILENVKWADLITVESFVSSFSSAKLSIDVMIKTNDEIKIYAKILLCALDLATNKIKKVSEVGVDSSFETHQSLISIDYDKIEIENETFIESVPVKFTSIDFCHHVHNVEYVRFIMNTYNQQNMEKQQLKSIQMNYLHQSFEKEILDIFINHNVDSINNFNVDKYIIKRNGEEIVSAQLYFIK